MNKALFLITELHRPVGGLYRYACELLPAWKQRIAKERTGYSPLVLSVRDPAAPLNDLRPSAEMKEAADAVGVKIYDAMRGGVKCYFLEAPMAADERNEFHHLLWEKYRIQSEKASGWDFYSVLNSFWKYAPLVAKELEKNGEKIGVIDSQDWLAFPAGFLTKEATGHALNCRFHSGEFGRSLGRPDMAAPPVQIERAALMEADFVQGVSVGEAKFEVYHLLPLSRDLYNQLKESKDAAWRREQVWKQEQYEEFLLLEPDGHSLLGTNAGGLPNGILLGDWLKVTKADVAVGRKALSKLLPDRKKRVLFIGRADYRKGIDPLIEAMALLADPEAGLVISTVVDPAEEKRLLLKAATLGISDSVRISNSWLEESMKKPLFCAADVIALPSLYEPFGIVTLEALAADLACERNGLAGPVVVVGDTGGMREVIRNGVNGFKVPIEEGQFNLDVALLARILALSLRGGELRERISKGGARQVQAESFDWVNIAGEVQELYKRAVKNNARSIAAKR